MEKEVTTQNIDGGKCPYCGVMFGEKWGKSARNNVRNLRLPITTNTGDSFLIMRVCREHLFTDEDLQWLVECHKLYFKEYHEDAHGNVLADPHVDSFQLKVNNE